MRNSVDKRLLATTFFAAAIVGMPLSASFAQSTHRQTTDEHYSRLFVPFWVKEGCAGALIPWGTPPYSHKDCITYTTKQTTVTEEKKHKHHHHKKYRKDRDHHKKYGKDHDRDHKKYGKDRDHDKYGKDRDHDKYGKDRDHDKYGKDRDHDKFGKDRDHDKYGKDRDHDKFGKGRDHDRFSDKGRSYKKDRFSKRFHKDFDGKHRFVKDVHHVGKKFDHWKFAKHDMKLRHFKFRDHDLKLHHDFKFSKLHHDFKFTKIHHDFKFTKIHHDFKFTKLHHDFKFTKIHDGMKGKGKFYKPKGKYHVKTKTKQQTTASSRGHHGSAAMEYVGSSIACSAVSLLGNAGLTAATQHRQLTLSESYATTLDCFVPFVGGWLVEMGMPDNAQTRHIARLAFEGKISNEKALEMYNKAYGFTH